MKTLNTQEAIKLIDTLRRLEIKKQTIRDEVAEKKIEKRIDKILNELTVNNYFFKKVNKINKGRK